MYKVESMPAMIDIGFTGEESFRKVEIDMTAWTSKITGGTPRIVCIRPGESVDDAYIAETTFANNILTWTITQDDLGAAEGIGVMQIWLEKFQGSTLKKRGKSILVATHIHGAINDPGDTIPPARTALLNLTAQAVTLAAGSSATVEVEHEGYYGNYILKIGVPSGANGAPGAKGDPGDPAPAAAVADAVDGYLAENFSNPSNPPLDRTLTSDLSAAPAGVVGDLYANMRDITPSDLSSDATDGDLDITDSDGNVILRLEDGHIKTKNFDSSVGSGDANAPKVLTTNKSGVDLDFTDTNGKVILRLKNGHIQTKNFDSSDAPTMEDLNEVKRSRTRMKFGAHNGAEYYAPECTVPAYRIAGQQGWEYAWIAGIDFSTDGTMYVLHDDTVDRTTDGTGYLNQMSDAQINALNIDLTGPGYDLDDFEPSELKIPTFEQVVQQCVRYGMKMVIRLALFPKNYDTSANIAKWTSLMEVLNGYGVPPEDISCYVSVLGQATIARNLIGPDVEISTFLGNSAVAQDYIDWFTERNITGRRAAILSMDNASLSAIKLLHSNGIRAYVYKYNPSEADAESCAMMGVDVFQNGKTYKIND